MKRRDFLKSTLPTAALMHTGLHGLLLHADTQESGVQMGEAYDLIVIGGSLSGCFAALHAARKGLKVLLIERRTFLATEITATMRPWLKRDGLSELPQELKDLLLPAEEQDEVGVPFDSNSSSPIFGDEIPLFMGTVKKQFMQALLHDNVHILLGTGVWGVLADEKQQIAAGVAVANKFGMQLVRSRHIIDARGRTSDPASRVGSQVAYSLELGGVAPNVSSEVSVPESLNLMDNKVFVHKGKRKPGQCFVEFRFRRPRQYVEREAPQRTEEVCGYLIKEHASFAKATLMQMAWETLEVPSDGEVTQDQPYSNYDCLSLPASLSLSCRDVLDAYRESKDRIGTIPSGNSTNAEPSFIFGARIAEIPLSECQLTPVDGLLADHAIQQISFPYERFLTETLGTDVVVAGGGTAGAMAALGSLQEGARTITVEYLPELGGTSTVGRVTGYYAGYKDTRFFEFIEDGVKKQSRLAGRCTRGVARMLHYRKQVTPPHGLLQTNSIICGVFKDRGNVTGLVVEGAGRLFKVMGDVFIDATGDGDVAALAGADYEVGNQRMMCTQNYSQWDVNPGLSSWKDSSTNRDYDIIWSHQLSEWQRGYQLSHRQAHYYDFTPFLTVRESRRITGDYKITLKDVILESQHQDTICLATSDYDPHHFGDTVFTRVGCLLPHGITAVVQIPYRAILPRGIDNLLISAKAISQTHNALQFTRMSFDIMTLGYVTGKIAARIVKQGIKTREFDVAKLQEELREWRILPPLSTPEASAERSGKESIERCIDELMTGKPNGLLKVMMQDRDAVELALRSAFDRAHGESQQLRLAQALAWLGNPVGNELILKEMNGLFKEEQAAGVLPREYYREDKATSYWTINQDIALLALSGDPAVLPKILRLADSLELGHPPVEQATTYNRGRIDLRLIPFYNRIVIICFALERMPDERAVRTLCRFLDDPFIRNHISKTPEEAGDKVYGGILESRLAATLARCGDKRGFTLLVEYLDDVHPMLVHYASQELETLLGVDHGVDRQQWKAHIETKTFPLAPTPRQEDVVEL